jgi:hypothetical protein
VFTLTIALGNASWPLVYKSEEKARDAYVGLQTAGWDSQTITDDFGQMVLVQSNSFHGALLEDMDKVRLAHIERNLYAARLQIDAQNAARSDPKIRAAQMGQGPAMIQPVGNGGLRM